MTPLASLILKDIQGHPDASARKYVRDLMFDLHYFEASELREASWELLGKLMSDPEPLIGLSERLFLPAPRTWIEMRVDGDGSDRLAFHLEERGDRSVYLTDISCLNGQSSFTPVGVIRFSDHKTILDTSIGWGKAAMTADFELATTQRTRWIYVLLALINTPKIIGRRQHMPAGGLERKLTRKLGAGSFPLHAWTEIKLRVAKSTEIDDGEPHEAHLTGRRALHFCRAHLRVRRGQVEYVSSHWRGDPAIGIKQSRYTVSP